MTRCPECGENSVEVDDFGSVQTDSASLQMVCTACGFVLDQSCLIQHTDDSQFIGEGSSNFYFKASLPVKQNCFSVYKHTKLFTECEKLIEDMGGTLGMLGASMKRALHLWKTIYESKKMKHLWKEKKLALAAACVYVACREEEQPVTLNMIIKAANFDSCHKVLYAMVKSICSYFDIILKPLTPGELLSKTRKSAGLDEEVEDIASKLVCLLEDVWMTTGLKPQNIAIISLFLAYEVTTYSVKKNQKQFPSFKKFATSLGFSRFNRHIYFDTVKMLCDLARELPWVTETTVITPKTVFLHVKDVIDHRNSLIEDTFIIPDVPGEADGTSSSSGEVTDSESVQDTPVVGDVENHLKRKASIIHPRYHKVAKKPTPIPPADVVLSDQVRENLDNPDLGKSEALEPCVDQYLRSSEEIKSSKSFKAYADIKRGDQV